MNSANVNFSITNLTYSVGGLLKGLSFVGGITEKGPINKPEIIISSWTQFQRIYGGLISNSDFPLMCKRALEYGGALRIARIAHYDDITDASTLTAVKATTTAFANSTPSNLFSLPLKYEGAYYNGIRSEVYAASNGNSAYFNLKIYHVTDSTFETEIYENLVIPGHPTVNNSHYLDKVIKSSQVVNVTYNDLSGLSGTLRPSNVVKTYSGGDDGDPVVVGDYIGDSETKTGIHAFDDYSDAKQMGFPEVSDSSLHVAGSAYAASRKDLQYFAHLDNASNTAALLITDRQGTNIDSMYTAFFAGGVKCLDPVTNLTKEISELGDVFGICAYSESVSKPWLSFAGTNRGKLLNALGVVNNFGTPALRADINLLSNAQINVVVNSDNQLYLSGNFSAQLGQDALSFNNAVRLLIYQQKVLGPVLKRFLEEPCDIPLFKKIFYTVKPWLDSLVTDRALFSYSWMGDQDVKKIEDVQINTLPNLQLGKYKVRLFQKIIPSLQEITIDIVVTALDVEFSIAAALPAGV